MMKEWNFRKIGIGDIPWTLGQSAFSKNGKGPVTGISLGQKKLSTVWTDKKNSCHREETELWEDSETSSACRHKPAKNIPHNRDYKNKVLASSCPGGYENLMPAKAQNQETEGWELNLVLLHLKAGTFSPHFLPCLGICLLASCFKITPTWNHQLNLFKTYKEFSCDKAPQTNTCT